MKKSNLLAAVALVPLSFGLVHAQEAQVQDPVQEEAPAETPPATDQTGEEAPDAGETDAPDAEAPATDAPATDAPATDAPATDAPATDAPEADAPMDAPESDAPMTDAPATDAPAAEEAPEMEEVPVTEEEPATEEAAEPANEEVLLQQQAQSELRGDWIIGANVQSPEDETVGSIVDVVIDPEQGDVTAAILSVGGFLGIGAKDIAVNWEQLQIDYDGQDIRIDLTRAEADAAPEYQFRDRQDPPAAAPMATDGMGTTGGGMATEPAPGTQP